jgi:hypothetical protein
MEMTTLLTAPLLRPFHKQPNATDTSVWNEQLTDSNAVEEENKC